MTETTSDAPLVFYWGSGSPYAWRAMLALEFKGLSYESRLLEFSKGQHRAPEILALNPRGKVPILVEGETVVYESLAIIAYLEARYPERPLFGSTPAESALVWRRVSEHSAYLGGAARRISRPIFFGKVEEKREDIIEAAKTVREELERLDASLADSPWLSGAEPGAADIDYWVTLQLLLRALGKPSAAALDLGLDDLQTSLPRVWAWHERFSALPGVDRTWPPHWVA